MIANGSNTCADNYVLPTAILSRSELVHELGLRNLELSFEGLLKHAVGYCVIPGGHKKGSSISK